MSYHCFSEKSVRARKPHRCIWCSYPVLEGSIYVREQSVYDGRHQNHAWHEACRKDACEHFEESGEGEFHSGNEMPFGALFRLEMMTQTGAPMEGTL